MPAGPSPAFVRRALNRAARVAEVAARLPVGGASVAVRITTDEELASLNRVFAGEEHATDVLSFAGEGEHLGDIAISWPADTAMMPARSSPCCPCTAFFISSVGTTPRPGSAGR